MPASPIRKLAPYAEDAVRRGIKIYHLNIGQPDIESPEVALEAIRNFPDKVIEYSHSAGNESYRIALAEHYKRYGVNITKDEVMITTGGSEAILFLLLATLDPGDEVIIPEPFYTNYYSYASEAGVNVVPITSYIDNDFALPPIKEFEKKIRNKTKGILICNPNNPTGYLYSKEELEKLRDLVVKHNLFFFSDEVYREFIYENDNYTSIMQLEGLEQNAIVIDSVSKRYSMCGLRTGAFITKNKDVYQAVLKYGQARLSPPSVGQAAGEAALKTPQSYYDQVYQEYLERRNYIIDAMNKIPGVKAPMPKGAFYTVIKLPVDSAEKFCQWMLEKFSYNNETVMLAPAEGFYATEDLGIDEVRLAYVLKVEDLKKAAKCIEEGLKAYPGRTI